MKNENSDAFDEAGRPVIQSDRRINFTGLSANCGAVLYALALTELRGNKLGLTRRSIRKVLHYENDPLAGSWDWLFDPGTSELRNGISVVAVRNAVKKLLYDYPISILRPGTYVDVVVPGYIDRAEGGVEPDVYTLNEGSIERWPCGARIITLLATGIPDVNPLKVETLARYMPSKHHSHTLPAIGQAGFGRDPTPHTLNDDIEFLMRARYLRLFTHEKGHRNRKEIAHAQPLNLDESVILELDERARWEQTYLLRLARLFQVGDSRGTSA